ncbi:MAG: TraR/DksA C4-type zinc finger protein [Proteobacteria bacterium]|nr:TraR/DksA C4-type zinc finger protein [Pseudomonadota bacterium]MBU4295951.1 TraR/DksA C4-type zinc finger protein [Pseudomonadota bacterium]
MNMEKYKEFAQLLDKAAAFHGHLCAGQVIGVRIAMLGLREIGISDPLGEDRKKLIVFVEIDRCATDAIMTVTGSRVGRRSLKIVDNGKMAATFINIETDKAVRIVSLRNAREKAAARYPELSDSAAQMQAYREMPDIDLFSVQDVSVALKPEDMPGRPTGRARCEICGETILDKRDIQQNGKALCRPCATGNTYYTVQSPLRPPLQDGGPL